MDNKNSNVTEGKFAEKTVEPDTGVNISKDKELEDSPVEKAIKHRTAAKYVVDETLAPLEKVNHLLRIATREKPINTTGFFLENLKLIAECFPAIAKGFHRLEEEEADIGVKLHRLYLDLMRWMEDRMMKGVQAQFQQVALTIQQQYAIIDDLRVKLLRAEHRNKVLFFALCEAGIFNKTLVDLSNTDSREAFENIFRENNDAWEKISARIYEERMGLEKFPGRYGDIRLRGGINCQLFNIGEIDTIQIQPVIAENNNE